MHLVLLVVLAMQSSESPAGEPSRGSLCVPDSGAVIVAKRCRSVEGTAIRVESHPDERPFGWISSDRSTLALGLIPGGEETVTLPDRTAAVNVKIKGSPDRNWPQITTLSIGPRDAPPLWIVELSAVEVVDLRTILLPAGIWDVRLRAHRHASTSLRPLRVEEPLDLGVITLDPLPQIRGTVIDREGAFLRAAMMISHDGAMLAMTDNFGQILYEAPCTEEANCLLPEGFRVEYPGTAPVSFDVANRKRDLDFDTLRLAEGGTLHLTLDRASARTPVVVEILEDRTARLPPPPYPSRTFSESEEKWHRLRLQREAPDLFERPSFFNLIRSSTPGEDEASVRFDNLPEGQLRVVLRGSAPGEYLSRFFSVAPGETVEMELAIRPVVLTVDVSRSGKDLEGLSVQITQWDVPGHKFALPPTGPTGQSTATIWESGKHSAVIVHPDIRAGAVFEIGEERTQRVAIDVVPASVSGRVVDAGTGNPLQAVTLRFDDGLYYGDFGRTAFTDEQGRFAVESVMPGTCSFEIRADGFLPLVRSTEIKPGHNDLKTLQMTRGAEYRVRVLWEDGTPIPGAVYLEASNTYGSHVADEKGEITFRRGIPLVRPSTFWIVPVEGSFARGERGAHREITIRVRRPGEKLILDFETADKEPVNFAHLNFAWDGEWIPREVRIAIESIQNKRFRSGRSSRLKLDGMPPGRYMVSAARSPGDRPWFPEWPWPPVTTIHYSGMEQTAKVIVRGAPPAR